MHDPYGGGGGGGGIYLAKYFYFAYNKTSVSVHHFRIKQISTNINLYILNVIQNFISRICDVYILIGETDLSKIKKTIYAISKYIYLYLTSKEI